MKFGWKKFDEMFPILTGHSFERHGHRRNSCIRNLMFYVSKTFPITRNVLTRMHHNDNVIEWLCSKKMSDCILTQTISAWHAWLCPEMEKTQIVWSFDDHGRLYLTKTNQDLWCPEYISTWLTLISVLDTVDQNDQAWKSKLTEMVSNCSTVRIQWYQIVQ